MMNHGIRILAAAMALTIGVAGAWAGGEEAPTGPIKTIEAPHGVWKQYAGEPKTRYAASMIWDEANDRVLMFNGEYNDLSGGGFPKFEFMADMWAFHPDKGAWERIEVKEKKWPNRRAYSATCYDPKRKGVWLHGGFRTRMYNDLWFFDCETNSWSQVAFEGKGPKGRDAHQMFYNPATDQIILFGGLLSFNTMQASNELWVYDIESKTWSEKPTGPSARFLYCGALDAKNQKLYVQGGFPSKTDPIGSDLWVYDIAGDQWGSEPHPRAGNFRAGAMALLAGRQRLVIFGGADTNREYYYDIAGRDWYAAPSDAPAPKRSYHSMCYDSDNQRMFIFGGTTGGFTGPVVEGEMWVREFDFGEE